MLFGGYEPDPVAALDRRRAVGARRPRAAARHGALRAAHGGRGAALPVPRGRRRRRARVPPRRDDPRRQPAARPDAGHPAASGWPPGSRSTASAAPAASAGRSPSGSPTARPSSTSPPTAPGASAPPTAIRAFAAAGARGLPLLLPPALPARRRRVGPADRLSPLHGRLQELGRCVRRQERLGARRPLRARAAVAAQRRRPARVRLGASRRGSSASPPSTRPSASASGSST